MDAAVSWKAAAALPAGLPAPRARLRLTAAGWIAGSSLIALLLAAINTANNLLYLLAAILGTALVVSPWLALATLRRVRIEFTPPREAEAGGATTATVSLRHAGRGPGAAGLVVQVEAIDAPRARRQAGGKAGKRDVRASLAAGVVPWLGRGQESTLALPLRFTRRGEGLVRAWLRCPFPLDLVEAIREESTATVLVLPLALPFTGRTPELAAGVDGVAARRRGAGVDLLSHRDYVPGDEARAIDWKATARARRPLVRETALDEGARVTLVVDPTLPGLPQRDAEDAVDDALARAAGAARELERSGWRLRLVAPGVVTEGSALDLARALARLPFRASGDALPQRAAARPGESELRFVARGKLPS